MYREMVGFSISDKMTKISGKVDKPNTYYEFSSDILIFTQGESKEVLHTFPKGINRFMPFPRALA